MRNRQVAGRVFFICLEGICGVDRKSVRFAGKRVAGSATVSFSVAVL
jgi:hypothetical protein